MTVKHIDNDLGFEDVLGSYGSKLVVIDFKADWCQPCKEISPFYDEMASKYNKAVFLKVDLNKCQETAAAQGVSSIPTFMFYKNKVLLDKIVGGSPSKLEEKIKKYYSVDEDGEETEVDGQIDLIGFVNKAKCIARNESDDHRLQHCLAAKGGYLESKIEQELVMPFIFKHDVKLHAIKIKAPAEEGPKTLELFVNRPKGDYMKSTSSKEPTQKILLTKDDLKGKPIILNHAKFQRVQNLYIVIKDNQNGRGNCKIHYLQLIGLPERSRNWGCLLL